MGAIAILGITAALAVAVAAGRYWFITFPVLGLLWVYALVLTKRTWKSDQRADKLDDPNWVVPADPEQPAVKID